MAITFVTKLLAQDGTLYEFAVDGTTLKMRDPIRTSYWTAFTLPTSGQPVTVVEHASGMLEVAYVSAGAVMRKVSEDDGVTWSTVT